MWKKVSVIFAFVMSLTILSGCSYKEETENENVQTEAEKTIEKKGFVLEYPEDMQKLGFTEPLVLDEVPERVISLSTAPVLALHELGVNLVGITSSVVVEWPEELEQNTEKVTFSAMSDEDYDFESVLALEPDLVFMAAVTADTAGAKLESLGVNVYYVYAGHNVSYDSVKMQTEALVKAFAVDEKSKAAGEAVMARFTELEATLEKTREAFVGKRMLVLQSGSGTAHYAQTKEGTLGSMLDQIGFENVYENEGSSMALLDYEQALDYNPDYIVCVGLNDADTQRKIMQEAFASNPEYWNSMTAVANGNVIGVDVTFISSAGINIVNNIMDLIDIMSEETGIKVE